MLIVFWRLVRYLVKIQIDQDDKVENNHCLHGNSTLTVFLYHLLFTKLKNKGQWYGFVAISCKFPNAMVSELDFMDYYFIPCTAFNAEILSDVKNGTPLFKPYSQMIYCI